MNLSKQSGLDISFLNLVNNQTIHSEKLKQQFLNLHQKSKWNDELWNEYLIYLYKNIYSLQAHIGVEANQLN